MYLTAAETNLPEIIEISSSAEINLAKINLLEVFEMCQLQKLSCFDTPPSPIPLLEYNFTLLINLHVAYKKMMCIFVYMFIA